MWTRRGLELSERTEVNNPSDIRGHVSRVPLQRRASHRALIPSAGCSPQLTVTDLI